MTDDLVEAEGLGQKWQHMGRGSGMPSIIVISAVSVGAAWPPPPPALSGKAHSAAARRGRPSTTVGVATVKQADVPVNIEALGTVTPPATVTVSPQGAGVLKQILCS